MPYSWRELSFGVEIEFSYISRLKAAEVVSTFFDTTYYHTEDNFDTYEIEDFNDRKWKICRDGSLRGERKQGANIVPAGDTFQVELVTPILNYECDMTLLQDLIRSLRKAGANVNNSCGIHIHIGAEEFDANHLRILCNLVYSKQKILERAIQVLDNRRRFCQLLNKDFIEKLNKSKPKSLDKFADIWYGFSSQQRGWQSYRQNKYHQSRYVILNLHNLLSGRMKTVEYRIFNSSLHAGVVKSYVQFCLLLSVQALNQSRASYKETVTSNDKWSMRIWLLKLNMIGDEFKTARHHLIKLLTGNSAWKDKVPEEITF